MLLQETHGVLIVPSICARPFPASTRATNITCHTMSQHVITLHYVTVCCIFPHLLLHLHLHFTCAFTWEWFFRYFLTGLRARVFFGPGPGSVLANVGKQKPQKKDSTPFEKGLFLTWSGPVSVCGDKAKARYRHNHQRRAFLNLMQALSLQRGTKQPCAAGFESDSCQGQKKTGATRRGSLPDLLTDRPIAHPYPGQKKIPSRSKKRRAPFTLHT